VKTHILLPRKRKNENHDKRGVRLYRELKKGHWGIRGLGAAGLKGRCLNLWGKGTGGVTTVLSYY